MAILSGMKGVGLSLKFPVLLVFLAGMAAPLAGAAGPGPAEGAGQTWLVRIADGTDPEAFAESIGAAYAGSLRGVDGYHRVRFLRQLESRPIGEDWKRAIARKLESEPVILAFEEEVLLERFPRNFVPGDPRFPDQWHLENIGQSGGVPNADARVRPVWDGRISGDGVIIGIVDEGIQYRHPDLVDNWVPLSGYDYNDDDSDPAPSGNDDRHGTAVAGISLASSNATGGLGVAYNARLVPLRLIAGPYESGEEAEALSYRRQEVAIYNNSWGPSDEAGVRYVDSSRTLKFALERNVTEGRGGRGNIYVWAAGNGGLNGDNSNYDGYNASPYTISVGAVGHDDIRTGYSEPGANLLVVAPSGGRGGGIVTTDNTGLFGYSDGDIYENFSGTSAATPIVSGVVALLLEERPDLGWRDVQQILAMSASPVDFSPEKWSRNGAGYWVSHDYGFGRVDAAAALRLAEVWPLLGPMRTTGGSFSSGSGNLLMIDNAGLERSIILTEPIRVQHVLVTVDITHEDWGQLRIELESPEGTRSVLAESHSNANSAYQPGEWTYLSTHHLGELSAGEWTLTVTDESAGTFGFLDGWSIEIMGTAVPPDTGDEPPNRAPMATDLAIESVVYPVELDAIEGITDPDGDPVEIISVQKPRYGSLDNLGDGRFRFTMGESKDGTDMFSILVADGRGAVARRLVQVLDPRPVGRNDLYPILTGRTSELPVLRNDLDPDRDPLRITGLSGAYSGEAAVTPAGTIRYTPPPGFTGVQRIQYHLTDDSDGASSGWATAVVQDFPEVALAFDGEDDFMRLRNAPDLNTNDGFTAEAWIYPEDWGEYVTGFGRIYDRSSFVFFLNGFDHSFYNDRSLVAYLVLDNGRGVAINSASGALELNRWQHVAISIESTDPVEPVRMYVDGLPVEISFPLDNTGPPTRPMSDNSGFPLYMGESDSGARAFKGRMTEFRIWDRVLPADSILANHDRRLTGAEPGLRLYFRLDQTLEPEAQSIGSLPVAAEISEAQRIPLELPWSELESHYTLLRDSGSGWWRERTLGWIYGDAYPWIYLSSLEWAYTGHGAEDYRYLFWPARPGWGWIRTEPGLYPWFYRYGADDWVLYLEGTNGPAWFYSSSGEAWFAGDAPLPDN